MTGWRAARTGCWLEGVGVEEGADENVEGDDGVGIATGRPAGIDAA